MLKKLFQTGLVVITVIGITSCASRKDQKSAAAKAGAASAQLTVGWVKDHDDSYDANVNILNNGDVPMIVLLSDLRCYKGTIGGEFNQTFFNTGERTMSFAPGEAKSFDLVCNLPQATQGKHRIELRKVWSNPNNDGRTTGAAIGQNIEWVSTEEVVNK